MSWQRILGHAAIVASFTAAWKRGRLGHAYLFVGPEGIGKHTFALELAKTLLCDKLQDRFEACDQCPSCCLVAAGTHPDLFMVARPSDKLEFPIDVIKEDLLPNLAMKPARGGGKVAILDNADDLNDEAANCFLKTLEEPPPRSLLILVGGTNAERQLPTILSRCQTIRFASIAPALVRQVLQEQGITDPSQQTRLLQLAAGSPGLALALDDEDVWAFRKHLLDMLRQDKIDLAAESTLWMQFINHGGKEAATHRHRASLALRMLLVLLQTVLKQSLGTIDERIDVAEQTAFTTIGKRLGEERILQWIERILEADRHIDRRVQLVLVIEALLDSLCR